VRAKLSTKHNGHWGGTSGDKAKFGLTVTEIVSVVYRLRQVGTRIPVTISSILNSLHLWWLSGVREHQFLFL
jgi:arginine decarboxylase-like protein